jgi:hypothetical protein
MAVAQSIGIDLRGGFLFRPTNPKESIVDKPLDYSNGGISTEILPPARKD